MKTIFKSIYKSLILLTVFLFLLPCLSPAQKMKKGIEHRFDMKTYIQAQKIVWYGWDFSKSRMQDINKFQDAGLIQGQFIPAISERLNKRITPELIHRNLDKDSLTVDLISVQDLYTSMNYKEFITSKNYVFPIDSVRSLIKSYKLPQNEGVGFVIIIEFMYKYDRSDRYVTGYVTFFDIKSREVLWATKMKGLPGSKYGFAMYWIEGIKELYDYFIGKYYNKSLREARSELGM